MVEASLISLRYAANNPNALKVTIKREENFFFELRKELSELVFEASSLANEDCPNFEKKAYFEIARGISFKILELCELGSYIAADSSAGKAYESVEKYYQTLDGFVEEAKALQKAIYLKTIQVDRAIQHLEQLVEEKKK